MPEVITAKKLRKEATQEEKKTLVSHSKSKVIRI
jgi:hypothetical protein